MKDDALRVGRKQCITNPPGVGASSFSYSNATGGAYEHTAVSLFGGDLAHSVCHRGQFPLLHEMSTFWRLPRARIQVALLQQVQFVPDASAMPPRGTPTLSVVASSSMEVPTVSCADDLPTHRVRCADFGMSSIPYSRVITDRPVEYFLRRYILGPPMQTLVVVSPFIGEVANPYVSLQRVTAKVLTDDTRLYVVTREPREPFHVAGIAVISECPLAEIRYNADIHAKLYVAWSLEETESYALFGSGNLTTSGLISNIELGMMIDARGHGRAVIRDLYQWATVGLRAKSRRVKAIEPTGRNTRRMPDEAVS